MNLKLKIKIIILFSFSILLRSIGFYDMFYGIEFLKDLRLQQHDNFWSLENIINIIPALFSLSGIFLYYYCFKRHLTRKYFNTNELIDLILIIYVFLDVSISVLVYLLSNFYVSFG